MRTLELIAMDLRDRIINVVNFLFIILINDETRPMTVN